MGKPNPGPHSKKCASTICPTCGKDFWYYLSWPRKYCSGSCRSKVNITNIKHFEPTRFTATCEQCGKQYEATPGITRGRFCSQPCHGAWMSAHVVGPAHPAFGTKRGRPRNLPPPITKQCEVCGVEFITKKSHLKRRRFCSRACRGIWLSNQIAGENNWNWQGGYEPYYGPSWRRAMFAVRKRDKVCQACGMTPEENGRALDVHHKTPFRSFGVARHREANRLDNLIALCHDCHLKVEWSTNRQVVT